VRLTLNEYKAGTVAYTSVVTAQALALSDAQTLLTTRENRLVASIALIQALGGGWNASSVGSPIAPEGRQAKLSQTSTSSPPATP
jgi:outer membrane protein TolC